MGQLWIAIGVDGENGRETLGESTDLDALKAKVGGSAPTVVYVPELVGSQTYGAYQSAVLSANEAIAQMDLPKDTDAGDMMSLEESRCFRVVYSTGTVSYECWQGTGAGGRWRSCPVP